MIILFILLFFGLSFSLIFTYFFFLILFGGGTCVTSAFFSVLLFDGILAKKFVMSHFFRIGWVSFGFTRMSRSGIKRTKWFGCQSFSKSASLVCHHNIDAVFSVFTRGEIVTFKSFRLTRGFFWFGINRSYVTADISQCIHMVKAAICFAPHRI